MSLHQLEQLIFDAYRTSDGRQSYLSDPGGYLRRYALSEEERQAVLRQDIGTLYDMGVHPVLLLYFSRIHDLSRDYLRAVPAAPAGKG